MLINNMFKNLGRLCVLSVIVAGPWRNGAFEPQYLRVLIYLTIASGALALLALWTAPSRIRRVNSYWSALALSIPLVLGLLLGCLQVVSFSKETLLRISPYVVEMQELLFPPETDLTLERLYDKEGDPLAAIDETIIAEQASLNQNFNDSVFPHEEGETSDVARALLVESALENEFLPQNDRNMLQEWGHTISIAPSSTRQLLPMFWAGLVLFLSSSVLFNSTASRRVLFKTVVFTGLALAALSIAMTANPSLIDYEKHNLWWLIDCKGSFGPYVNKNAGGGYLVLCFGACLYFVAREFMTSARRVRKELEVRRKEKKELEQERLYKKLDDPRWKIVLGDMFELFNRRLVFWLGALGFLYASILASMSRGAAVAATVAFVLAIVFMSFRKETRRFWYVPLVTFVIAFSALVGVSMHESVDERMSTLIETDEQGDTAFGRDLRWENWRAALETSQHYPWFGSGLGTYRIANYTNDQASKYGKLFYYAENSFIQTTLEMGRVGLALILLEYLLLFCLTGRFLMGRHSIETTAFAIGAVAIMLGQTFASCVDFGIYLPANLFMFAILCGASVGRQNNRLFESLTAKLAKKEDGAAVIRELKRLSRLERVGLAVFSVLLIPLLLGFMPAQHENADHIKRRDLLRASDVPNEKLMHMNPNAVDRLIEDLRSFISYRDDSYEVRSTLAELSILRFRLRYKEHLQTIEPDASPEKLWEKTSPELYLISFLDYQWRGMKIPTDRARKNEFVKAHLKEAVGELFAARRISPLQPESYPTIVGLAPLCSELTWDDERVFADLYSRRGAALGPYDAGKLVVAGYRLGCHKLWPLEKRFLKRAAEFNNSMTPKILTVIDLTIPDSMLRSALEDVIPNDPQTLCREVVALSPDKNSALFEALKEKTKDYFANVPEDERDSNYYYWSGYFYHTLEEYEIAQELLEKSYELDNTNDDAFFRYVQILVEHSSVLMMDEKCIEALEKYCQSHRGEKLWRAEDLLDKAKANLKRNNAVLEARERIRKERETDERIKREVRMEKAFKEFMSRAANESNNENVSTPADDLMDEATEDSVDASAETSIQDE